MASSCCRPSGFPEIDRILQARALVDKVLSSLAHDDQRTAAAIRPSRHTVERRGDVISAGGGDCDRVVPGRAPTNKAVWLVKGSGLDGDQHHLDRYSRHFARVAMLPHATREDLRTLLPDRWSPV